MTTLFKLVDKVAAFKDKLKLWEQRVNKGVFDIFQTLAETLKDSKPGQAFSDFVRSHLHVLLQEFKRYFPSAKDPRTAKKWIRNPFIFKPGDSTQARSRGGGGGNCPPQFRKLHQKISGQSSF